MIDADCDDSFDCLCFDCSFLREESRNEARREAEERDFIAAQAAILDAMPRMQRAAHLAALRIGSPRPTKRDARDEERAMRREAREMRVR